MVNRDCGRKLWLQTCLARFYGRFHFIAQRGEQLEFRDARLPVPRRLGRGLNAQIEMASRPVGVPRGRGRETEVGDNIPTQASLSHTSSLSRRR